MRKIVVGLMMSFDGIIEGPGPMDSYEHAGWTMPYFNNEVGMIIGTQTAASDALLLGRVTYEGFAAAFASMQGGDADAMNNIPKYVVSSTLKSADWQNSMLISGNVPEAIAKLKQQPGKDISISGSGTLIHTLMQHDLIDEYSLIVFPVVLRTGARLFPESGAKIDLKLIEAKPLNNGVVHMRYQPASKA